MDGSGIAVAVTEAGVYSSDSTLSLGTSVCLGCGPKKTKKKKKKKERERERERKFFHFFRGKLKNKI